MRPITVSVGPLAAASANNIALSQTPGAAGALILNGSLVPTTGAEAGEAVLDNPRRILITTADTTTKFTIVGVSQTDTLLTESFLVVGGSSYSTLDYAEVSSITINQGTTAAVTVGTNGIASTPWVRFDEWANTQIAVQCDVVGTVNYTVQSTMNDPNSPTNPVTPSAVNWISTNDSNAVGATGGVQTYFSYSPTFARILLNSSGTTGTVTGTFIQADVVSR
jgi:hypothetical protein